MRTVALSLLCFSLSLATAGAAPDGTASGLPGQKEFSQCRKLPAGKRVLKMNFKPDSEIADLIGWMSTITCTSFITNKPDVEGKRFTIHSPQLMTAEEVYELFIGALESAGLTVQPISSKAAGKDATMLKIVKKPAR